MPAKRRGIHLGTMMDMEATPIKCEEKGRSCAACFGKIRIHSVLIGYGASMCSKR